MPHTFDWVEIQTYHIEQTARFYEDVFGWTITRKDSADGFDVWIFETGGEPRTENLRRGGIWARPPGSSLGVTVYVVVEDIEAVLHRVRELGGSVVMERTPQGDAHRACFADPDGNRLGLWEEPRVAG